MICEVLTLEQLRRLGASGAAALLMVRQDAGDDGHDEAVFDEWLAADPAHVEAWTRACSVWESFDAADDSAELRAMRGAVEADPPKPTRWGFAVAASVAALAAIGGAVFVTKDGTGSVQVASVEPARLMLTTARGEHRSFALADASTVTLNTGSAVAVAFRPNGERRLELIRGQAFFKVAHDRTRPFVVAVDGRTVTALGTAFEVRSDPGNVRVVLVEGRVSVSRAGGAPVEMRAGQQLVAGPRGIMVSKADLAAVDDWQRGVVTFRETTLEAAAAELNRYSGPQLTVADPRVARLTVSGVFHTDDTPGFARAVQKIHPVRVVAGERGNLELVGAR